MKKIIVIGDRLLIKPDESEEKTPVGLILPQTVRDKDEVMRGTIVGTGPGLPLADPASLSDEPWAMREGQRKFMPMEAHLGDYALFLKKAAVEIHYENERYFIVPQAAILLLIRDEETPPPLDESDIDLP